jgi:hypothetical protein
VSPLELLRDVLARVIWIREELDPLVRDQALEDLEIDLADGLARLEERRAA